VLKRCRGEEVVQRRWCTEEGQRCRSAEVLGADQCRSAEVQRRSRRYKGDAEVPKRRYRVAGGVVEVAGSAVGWGSRGAEVQRYKRLADKEVQR